METISVAREFINSNDYLASVDLSDASFRIPSHESYRKFPRFIWKEQFTSLSTLHSGDSLAPRTFTEVLKPLYSLLRFNGMKAFYYIDDALVVAVSRQNARPMYKIIRH